MADHSHGELARRKVYPREMARGVCLRGQAWRFLCPPLLRTLMRSLPGTHLVSSPCAPQPARPPAVQPTASWASCGWWCRTRWTASRPQALCWAAGSLLTPAALSCAQKPGGAAARVARGAEALHPVLNALCLGLFCEDGSDGREARGRCAVLLLRVRLPACCHAMACRPPAWRCPQAHVPPDQPRSAWGRGLWPGGGAGLPGSQGPHGRAVQRRCRGGGSPAGWGLGCRSVNAGAGVGFARRPGFAWLTVPVPRLWVRRWLRCCRRGPGW